MDDTIDALVVFWNCRVGVVGVRPRPRPRLGGVSAVEWLSGVWGVVMVWSFGHHE